MSMIRACASPTTRAVSAASSRVVTRKAVASAARIAQAPATTISTAPRRASRRIEAPLLARAAQGGAEAGEGDLGGLAALRIDPAHPAQRHEPAQHQRPAH